MAEVRWIKLFIDMWNNRKIKQIETLPDGDTVLIIWLKLLTLAGNINDGGMVYFTKDIPFNEQMLANEFGRPLETVRMALSVFEKFGMVEIIDNMIYVSNWEKYQNRTKLDDIREYNRLKQREHRERVNLLSTMSVDSQDTERREKKEERRTEEKSVKHFVPPTVEEVRAYCEEYGKMIECERFVDYYESKGWMIGKNHMKDWKAAVRNWCRGRMWWTPEKKVFKADEMEAEEQDINDLRRRLGLPEVEES